MLSVSVGASGRQALFRASRCCTSPHHPKLARKRASARNRTAELTRLAFWKVFAPTLRVYATSDDGTRAHLSVFRCPTHNAPRKFGIRVLATESFSQSDLRRVELVSISPGSEGLTCPRKQTGLLTPRPVRLQEIASSRAALATAFEASREGNTDFFLGRTSERRTATRFFHAPIRSVGQSACVQTAQRCNDVLLSSLDTRPWSSIFAQAARRRYEA